VIDIPSHNTIEERIAVAKKMKEEMEIDSNIEVLVDNMENDFNKEFAAWPIRYFIAKDGKLLHKSDNSIDNDLFDQDSIQNFFRGLGFVPFPGFVPVHRFNFKLSKEKPPRPKTRMAHMTSSLLLMACCCSPCICVLAPGYICVSKIRKTVKKNSRTRPLTHWDSPRP